MSFSISKLRSLLPGQHSSSTSAKSAQQRHSMSLDPEIGFQISIESVSSNSNGNDDAAAYTKTTVPELNVHLIAARHLPALFGFKVVQGYLIKVKLFPGSKRLDSSIQTNSWPKFNENFKFPLAPDLKPSLKHSSRRSSRTVSEFTPEELFAGQFVVFTVYALLELPPATFTRLNKTYRSLRDKSSNLVQKVVESSSGGNKSKDDKENSEDASKQSADSQGQKVKRNSDANPRDIVPPLTISEARRNIGSVTCYLEPKIFRRNPRNGLYSTDELWLPIKDITTTVIKGPSNNLANSAKGVVELVLEVRDQNAENVAEATTNIETKGKPKTNTGNSGTSISPVTPPTTPTTPSTNGVKNYQPPQWNRMTSEVKRKMGISKQSSKQHDLVLRVTTARMRCNNKVKDELESTAGTVYVKTTVFEHGIYIGSWKSSSFYPSLSTKWDVGGDTATISIPLQSMDDLENIIVRTTLATKTKLGKKMVLGTVMVGAQLSGAGSGAEHMKLLQAALVNERVALWHSYQ